MKTIHIQVDDENLESFLIILKNLKNGFIKNFIIEDEIESVDDKEQEFYENLINNLTEEDKKVSSKEIIEI